MSAEEIIRELLPRACYVEDGLNCFWKVCRHCRGISDGAVFKPHLDGLNLRHEPGCVVLEAESYLQRQAEEEQAAGLAREP